MSIVRHFETEQEYRKHKALSSTQLASYWHDGIYSPDHALMKFEYKSYFEYGKMFETLLQDTVKGTNDFLERFFISNVQGNRPNDLIKWIESGEDLTKRIVYNKDGKTRSGSKRTVHAFIDECIENPGLIPVSVEEYKMLMMHVDRMCEMPYLTVKCGDLLAKGEWQVGIKWQGEYDGLEKKALLDVVTQLDGLTIRIDIKTSADERNFGYRLKDHYWIQDAHYSEGADQCFDPAPHDQMGILFLVAFKQDPFICQPWSVVHESIDQRLLMLNEYRELCESYSEWEKKGKPPRGWLPMKRQKVYLQKRI